MNTNQPSKIGVLTSGGDSPGMNAAIRSVARTCAFYNIPCYGIHSGYNGMIDNHIYKLGSRDVKFILNLGGTILKSARSIGFKTKEGRQQAYDHLQKKGIDGLIVIGGDGSFTGAKIFYEEFNIPTIGIPGTIDNDIYGTDNTLGFDTALNTAVEAIDKIRDTANSHDRIFFVEVMGRDAGYIALNSGIATGAVEIIIPENTFDIQNLVTELQNKQKNGKTSNIIVVSESEKLTNVYDIAKYTQEHFSEADVRVTVLGHIQRGGSPSCYDRVLGSKMGVIAVESLLKGESNKMVGEINQKMVLTDFETALTHKSKIDPELMRISNILSN